MQEILIENTSTKDTIVQLKNALQGEFHEQWGELTLKFDNEFGQGTIRGIDFDYGLSLIDFNVNFIEATIIIFKSHRKRLVEFIFVSEGNLDFKDEDNTTFVNFDRYQNIIISNRYSKKKTFVFPKELPIKVNIIQLETASFIGKKNNNINYLDKVLRNVFEDENDDAVTYQHLGSYSLKIADQIKKLSNSHDSGIVRTLSIEGQLNLIMAMQMLEHQNFERKKLLPESLSPENIKKIQLLSTYIVDNISEPLSVDVLSKLSGMGPKKLQTGFKLLYSKSVNEYIRDLKLEIARDALTNSHITISEIVYNIGFKSRSYFSKIFAERYGILPNKYRSSLSQSVDD